MICIISPAKTIDESEQTLVDTFKKEKKLEEKVGWFETPIFEKQANELVEKLANLSSGELSKVLKTSGNLTTVNFQRYKTFIQQKNRIAGVAFSGAAFKGLRIGSLPVKSLQKLHKSVFILSGLYGILSVFDQMKPYRLDVANKLDGNDLYGFWEDTKLTEKLCETMKNEKKSFLLNLASSEYSKMINKKILDEHEIKFVNCELMTGNHGKLSSYDMKFFRGFIAKEICLMEKNNVDELCEENHDDFKFEKVDDETINILINDHQAVKKRKI